MPTDDALREVLSTLIARSVTVAASGAIDADPASPGVQRAPGEVSDESAALLRQPSAGRSFDVTVDEYGTGTLSLAVR